ncbi:sarcosine oxidase subunit gamma [Rhodospirillum sp. A1_3_36]|uniref:sarcosine oxidase subunit gamma n=1 Tax=Rhodospirillum sp. A1_3_36 TaxID=3391666 RepID=UPI0039A425BB
MSDFRLNARSAFGAAEPRIRTIGAYRVVERTDLALSSLAARVEWTDVHNPSTTILGCPLPGVGGLREDAGVTTFWTGPDQWMVMAPLQTHEDLAADLTSALGERAAVTDQTDGWVAFDLTGEGLETVLEGLTSLDIRAMGAGGAARTVMEHMGCFLLCRDPGRAYTLLVGRSFAVSLAHALEMRLNTTLALTTAKTRSDRAV